MIDPTYPTRLSPAQNARMCIRGGDWTGTTAGLARCYAQANLIALPTEMALEFVRFCLLNWAACPILEVLEPGCPYPSHTAMSADLRTDLPRYLIYRHGILEKETTDATPFWDQDMVAVLLGCSFSVDSALLENGIPVRYIEEGRADPTFVSNLPCLSTSRLSTNLLVSMQPIPLNLVESVTEITSRFVRAHGGPINVKNPTDIGINDSTKPNFGEAVTLCAGDVPMFWACGLTALTALLTAKPRLVVSHKPGHMFITDLKDHELTRMASDKHGR